MKKQILLIGLCLLAMVSILPGQTDPVNGLPQKVNTFVPINDIWAPNSEKVATYNDRGELTTELITFADGSQERRTYSSSPNLGTTIVEKNINGQWIPFSKSVQGIDDEGGLVRSAFFSWNGTEWVDIDGAEYVNIYRGNLLTQKTASKLNTVTKQMENDYRISYAYNQASQLDYTTLEDYKNNAFVNQSQTFYTWKSENQIDNMQVYDWRNNQWQESYKFQYTWTDNRSYSSIMNYYNQQNHTYTPTARQSFAYDQQGNQTLYSYENWLNNNWSMVRGNQYFLNYDGKNLTERITKEWKKSGPEFKTSGGDWANSLKEVFSQFYILGIENPKLNPERLQVFPCPTTDGQITISGFHHPGPCEVMVINSLGQIVFSQKVFQSSENIRIDLQGQSTGLYSVSISDHAGRIGLGTIIVQ
jgi:hypothetical protein